MRDKDPVTIMFFIVLIVSMLALIIALCGAFLDTYSRHRWREATASYNLERLKEEAVEQYKLEHNIE